jgi:hypothetical protein
LVILFGLAIAMLGLTNKRGLTRDSIAIFGIMAVLLMILIAVSVGS